MKKLFTINSVLWFDKVNGNTYHSCQIIRHCDNKTIYCPMVYGYGDSYKETAICAMADNGMIPPEYKDKCYMYERDTDYPIIWNKSEGTKKACIANGQSV